MIVDRAIKRPIAAGAIEISYAHARSTPAEVSRRVLSGDWLFPSECSDSAVSESPAVSDGLNRWVVVSCSMMGF
jgi:hypothetical protein